jgi:thymidylate synthase
MNNLDKQYQQLLSDIIEFGVEKEDRTGTGTISEFGHQFRHKMSEGFPLLTTKKMHWKSIVTELLWFLRGDTNIKFLLDYDCHIWDGDAYKRYKNVYDIESRESKYALEELHMLSDLTKEQFTNKIKTDETFAEKWGELGPIYGKQWRNWESVDTSQYWQEDWSSKDTDQIQNLINELKTNPDSRRLMVSAWNVGELDKMVLPPCHYGFQLYTRKTTRDEKIVHPGKYRAISLMWNQRSVDTFLGLPFNIASYGLLLEIIAKEVNMIPDELIGNLGDVHLYKNHIEQAKEQISRTSFDLPKVEITERNWYQHQLVKEHLGEKTLDEKLKSYRPDCFELIGYESHPKIKAPLSN